MANGETAARARACRAAVQWCSMVHHAGSCGQSGLAGERPPAVVGLPGVAADFLDTQELASDCLGTQAQDSWVRHLLGNLSQEVISWVRLARKSTSETTQVIQILPGSTAWVPRREATNEPD